MLTPFHLLTLITFGGLMALMFRRSLNEFHTDKLWHYAPPAIGCALVDYIGTSGYRVAGAIGLVLVLAYIYYVIRPSSSDRID